VSPVLNVLTNVAERRSSVEVNAWRRYFSGAWSEGSCHYEGLEFGVDLDELYGVESF